MFNEVAFMRDFTKHRSLTAFGITAHSEDLDRVSRAILQHCRTYCRITDRELSGIQSGDRYPSRQSQTSHPGRGCRLFARDQFTAATGVQELGSNSQKWDVVLLTETAKFFEHVAIR